MILREDILRPEGGDVQRLAQLPYAAINELDSATMRVQQRRVVLFTEPAELVAGEIGVTSSRDRLMSISGRK